MSQSDSLHKEPEEQAEEQVKSDQSKEQPTKESKEQPPTYAEAMSSQAYLHEPSSITLAPVRRARIGLLRPDPPVHDISAGDKFVAFVDNGVRKVFKKLTQERSEEERSFLDLQR